jgi:chromate transporter
VAALIVRAVERIGRHALSSRVLWAIAVVAFGLQLLGVPFWLALGLGGVANWLLGNGKPKVENVKSFALRVVLACIFVFVALAVWWIGGWPVVQATSAPSAASLPRLFWAGLRGGLLTFGGAYTAIPFVQGDTVGAGWITQGQFLDALAITNVLPTPLVMFTAFVGYLGAGLPGALAMATGMFVPAFAFTLIGHEFMERLVDTPQLHAALDGVTATVVGIVAATALQLALATLGSPLRIAIFALALLAAFRLKGRWATAAIVLSAGLVGAMAGV